MTITELTDLKTTINWLLENGQFEDTETSCNIAMNAVDTLENQLSIHGVSKSLKDKHTQDLFEYKQQLKKTDNNDTLFIDNKEEWIRQTSILAGKISILEDL